MDTKGFKTIGRKEVEEVPWGMYVWEIVEDGQAQVLGDGEGNVMNVFCLKNDRRAIQAITDAARSYGFPEGRAVWWSGKRPIDDEQLEEQEARAKFGLIPDPLDYGAITDEIKTRKAYE